MNATHAIEGSPPLVDFVTFGASLPAPDRAPDRQAQMAAFNELAARIVENPGKALYHFPRIARRLCAAGTAGLSLLRSDGAGHETISWMAIDGALSKCEGTETPRDFSPCGLCLDSARTVLVSRPARVFPHLRFHRPVIVEDLIVPLYGAASKPLGTLWMVHHDAALRFSTGDVFVLEQLSIQLVLTLSLIEQARRHQRVVEFHEATRRVLARDLAHERGRHARAEASNKDARSTLRFKEELIADVNHRAKNTIQIAASLLALHANTSTSEEVRDALQQGHARLHVLVRVHELLYKEASDTQEVLMSALFQQIADLLRLTFNERPVRLHMTADPVLLPPADAIPLALLVNEAVTNAYKHAFSVRTSGEITVVLTSAPDGALLLQVTDNGDGMNSAGQTPGLGLKLIHSFAVQLAGTLMFENPTGGGTQLTLKLLRSEKDREAWLLRCATYAAC